MHQHTQALVLVGGLLKCDAGVPPDAELGDCVGNGIVEATVQRAKFIDGERGIEFNGEVCDGLAEVALVVHHLVDGKAKLQQLLAVRSGAQAHFGQGSCVTASGT
ncbi:hypothetical protein WKW77_33805 [Variovorax ureilyticus]|uniref:Uncharacterized protein n=1 Tax=Variovorax ureilyticus TaxID=1836198 RepID=A0ABU8VR64_9BURK